MGFKHKYANDFTAPHSGDSEYTRERAILEFYINGLQAVARGMQWHMIDDGTKVMGNEGFFCLSIETTNKSKQKRCEGQGPGPIWSSKQISGKNSKLDDKE